MKPPSFFLLLLSTILILAIAIWAVTIAVYPAHPDEWSNDAQGDPSRSQWFDSLKDDRGYSCCDISDCRRTRARQLADGTWEAIVPGPDGPVWAVVPPQKILKTKSIDGEAYLCSNPPLPRSATFTTIYCFVKPSPGY